MGNLNILNGFNADDFEDSFDLLPKGDYEVEITDSEFKENSKKTGSFLSVTFKVVSGESKGRLLFDNFNLVHSNPKAVEIAQQQFSGLCKAVGVLTPGDSSDLHNIPLVISVDIDGEYNRVKRYKAKEDAPKGNLEGKIKSESKKKSSEVSKKPATPKAEEQSEEFDDDIPF